MWFLQPWGMWCVDVKPPQHPSHLRCQSQQCWWRSLNTKVQKLWVVRASLLVTSGPGQPSVRRSALFAAKRVRTRGDLLGGVRNDCCHWFVSQKVERIICKGRVRAGLWRCTQPGPRGAGASTFLELLGGSDEHFAASSAMQCNALSSRAVLCWFVRCEELPLCFSCLRQK